MFIDVLTDFYTTASVPGFARLEGSWVGSERRKTTNTSRRTEFSSGILGHRRAMLGSPARQTYPLTFPGWSTSPSSFPALYIQTGGISRRRMEDEVTKRWRFRNKHCYLHSGFVSPWTAGYQTDARTTGPWRALLSFFHRLPCECDNVCGNMLAKLDRQQCHRNRGDSGGHQAP